MASEDKLYIGAIKTEIALDSGVDLTAAGYIDGEVSIYYIKPGGTKGVWSSAVIGDMNTDPETKEDLEAGNNRGVIYTTTSDSDLDAGGDWRFNLRLDGGAGSWSGFGETVTKRVYLQGE